MPCFMLTHNFSFPQAHAAAALVNFSEDCPKPILTQYLDPLMCKLEVILTTKFKEVRFISYYCSLPNVR